MPTRDIVYIREKQTASIRQLSNLGTIRHNWSTLNHDFICIQSRVRNSNIESLYYRVISSYMVAYPISTAILIEEQHSVRVCVLFFPLNWLSLNIYNNMNIVHYHMIIKSVSYITLMHMNEYTKYILKIYSWQYNLRITEC